MLEMNVVEPSEMKWDAPVLIVPKNSCSSRFFPDNWELSEVTEQDSYYTPRQDEYINSLEHA